VCGAGRHFSEGIGGRDPARAHAECTVPDAGARARQGEIVKAPPPTNRRGHTQIHAVGRDDDMRHSLLRLLSTLLTCSR
jgi:hypothetical protein